MSDLQVIYDPALEIAAIINLDDQVAWGPAMVGPNADEILTAWLDATPFDVSMTDTYLARDFFRSFLDRVATPAAEAAVADREPPSQPSGGDGVVESRSAENEARAASGEPPAAAPVDTDVEARQGEAGAVTQCPHCQGEGTVIVEEGQPPVTCPLCQGAKFIRVT